MHSSCYDQETGACGVPDGGAPASNAALVFLIPVGSEPWGGRNCCRRFAGLLCALIARLTESVGPIGWLVPGLIKGILVFLQLSAKKPAYACLCHFFFP